jgi:two-component system OmpR family response regulator
VLEVDRAAARIWRDGAEIRLTAREWALFDALLGARGRVMPKALLEDALGSFDAIIEGNAVEVYVSRLRGKLGAGTIETRRGLGYVLP